MMPKDGPLSAFLLGWSGVVPFAFLTLASLAGWTLPVPPDVALTAYGAAILSFMGGAQWGLAMRAPGGVASEWRGYAISVVPALLAWCALLIRYRVGLVLMMAGFAALLAYDVWTVRQGEAPPWYARLRVQLTLAVVVLLALASLA